MHVTDSFWLDKFLSLLELNLGQPQLSNEFLAKEMGISKRQFYRKVKAETGVSPNHFIQQYKLQKAMKMLQSGNFHTVQEISLKLGYQNQHYFSMAFEKKYHERPFEVLKRLGLR